MRLLRAAALLLLILPPAAMSETPKPGAPAFADRVPRAWCGVFRWESEAREQHVTIKFDRFAARDGGTVEAEGPGLVRYEDELPDRAIPFRMRAVIDPATRRIEMFERIDVPRSDYVTDGSHLGTLAPDLRSMSTVWITRGSGKRGAMRMNARPDEADLAQGCAPPSSRAPDMPIHNSLVLFAGLTPDGKFAIN
jgi:hypothetical protein